MNVYEHIKDLINREVLSVQKIPINDSFEIAVEMIYEQVHQLGGKLVVSGLGKAGQIGNNIATTLSSTGTPSVFLHPAEAQHGDLGILQKNDLLFLISNSGKTREVVELADLARALKPDIKIICLTGTQDSLLTKKAQVILFTGCPEEICPLGLTPTTSTTVMTVIGDILVVLLLEKTKFSKKQYALRHHSGYLGEKAKQDE